MAKKLSERIKELQEKRLPFYSFEYFPPKSSLGLERLLERVSKLDELKPLYHDVAYGAAGASKECDIVNIGSLVNTTTHSNTTQIHVTLTGVKKEELVRTLKEAKERGIKNILALRGDPPKNIYKETKEESEKAIEEYWKSEYQDLRYASDFISFIRKETGDHFCISAAGYPEGHPRGSYEKDLEYLKEKVKAGADFIITQFFYDVKKFLKLKEDCSKLIPGVPLIPGIMPIVNMSNWKKLLGYCKVSLPDWMQEDLKKLDQTNREQVVQFGIDSCVKVCKQLIEGGVHGFLFYTMNMTKSVSIILNKLGYLKTNKKISKKELIYNFPWLIEKSDGLTRPIFWSTRPKSFLTRTREWTELPEGPSFFKQSPGYGNFQSYNQVSRLNDGKDFEKKRMMWGSNLKNGMEDVKKVFINFLNGKVAKIPWVSSSIQNETTKILDDLIKINQKGFLTINSQPRANCVRSDDKKQGWKTKGGYVWKKAYVEFFCSSSQTKKLVELLPKYKRLSFYCSQINGKAKFTNTPVGSVNTITWGVFDNQCVFQPSIVDDFSFQQWCVEAFDLWNDWKIIYKDGSEDRKVIQNIVDSFSLITIVDNNFIDGDLFEIFEEFK